MNELKIFNYNDNEIRTIEKEDGVWWVANDVCNVFGETNRNRAMQPLEDKKARISGRGGETNENRYCLHADKNPGRISFPDIRNSKKRWHINKCRNSDSCPHGNKGL